MAYYDYRKNRIEDDDDDEDFVVNAPLQTRELRQQPRPLLPRRRQKEELGVSVLLLFGIFATAVAFCTGYLAKDYTDAAQLGTVPIICTPGFLPNLEACKSLSAEYGVKRLKGLEYMQGLRPFDDPFEPSNFTHNSSLPLAQMGLDFTSEMKDLVTLNGLLMQLGYIIRTTGDPPGLVQTWLDKLFEKTLDWGEFYSLKRIQEKAIRGTTIDFQILNGRLSHLFDQMMAYQKNANVTLTRIQSKLSGPQWPRKKGAIDQEIRDSMKYIADLPSLKKDPPKSFKLSEDHLENLILILDHVAHPDQTQGNLKVLRLGHLGDISYWCDQLKLHTGGEIPLDELSYAAVKLSQYYRAIVTTNITVSKTAEVLEVVEKKLNKLRAYLGDKKKPITFGDGQARSVEEYLRVFAECMQEMQKSVDEETRKQGFMTLADRNARAYAAIWSDYL